MHYLSYVFYWSSGIKFCFFIGRGNQQQCSLEQAYCNLSTGIKEIFGYARNTSKGSSLDLFNTQELPNFQYECN